MRSWIRADQHANKLFSFCPITESKNQEVPEQDANGGAKTDLTAIQNHNLLIALAQHGGATGSPFAMPVSRCFGSKTL